jgi:uncharacterized protein
VPKNTHMVVIENFGTCNMRCTYCFPEHMWQRQGHRGAISEETYRGTLDRVFATTSSGTVDVHLAGGEPLLAGQAWLEHAFATARETASRHGKAVTFSLQTNATMVTPELARCLADNNVTVGVSLDGDRVINEAVRGHTDRTLTGFARLTDAFGRPPGVIVTVTRCNAARMAEVVAYLDTLEIALFRANQMGATASWNEHAAPRAEEWAIFEEIAGRRGRMMEFNLTQAIPKFVRSLLGETPPFQIQSGCCAMRCPAGRELIYFDREGNSYPCPRANVTPEARIGHYAAPDFEAQWDAAINALDDAMDVPPECRACPAQIACDYGCHAFNVAGGNFFEVNCDASKDYFRLLTTHLEETARLFLLISWREQRKARGDYSAVRAGVDVPNQLVDDLATQLRLRLDRYMTDPGRDGRLLDRRYGWRGDQVPVAVLDRPRVGATVRHRPGKGR